MAGDSPHAGLLGQLAGCGVGEVLVDLHEPAGQGQSPAVGLLSPRDEQDMEVVVADGPCAAGRWVKRLTRVGCSFRTIDACRAWCCRSRYLRI